MKMSAQIYSRYVPPAKKQKLDIRSQSTSTFNDATEPATASRVNTAAPAIRNDASSTYARYVPSPKPKSSKAEKGIAPIVETDTRTNNINTAQLDPPRVEPSSKRARKANAKASDINKLDKTFSTFEDQSPTNIHDATQDEGAEQSNKQKRKEKSRANSSAVDAMEGVQRNGDFEEDATHRKLMAKREKSLRKAERLAEKAAQKDAMEEDIPPEEELQLYDLIPLPQPEPVAELPVRNPTTSLPSWLASPIRVSSTARLPFLDVGVPNDAIPTLSSKGFNDAFAIQSAVLPLLLPGPSQQPGDILVSAATGSGKTLAYALPMIEEISRTVTTRLRGLIVVPTRELVLQARDVAEMCASACTTGSRRRVKIATAMGSENLKSEQASIMKEELKYDPDRYRAEERRMNSKWASSDGDSDGDDEPLYVEELVSTLEDHVIESHPKVDVLICTPGRLVEHLKSTPGFSLEYLNWLVADEADKLLDQSFQQWLPMVIRTLEKDRKVFEVRPSYVRKIILSATMTRDVGQLSGLKLYRPKLVVLESSAAEDKTKTNVSQGHALPDLLIESGIKVEDESIKPLYLLEVLRREGLVQRNVQQSSDDSSSSSSSSDSGSDSDSDSSNSEFSDHASPISGVPTESEAVPHASTTANDSVPRGVLIFTKSNETAVRLERLVALLDPDTSSTIATLTSSTRSSARRSSLKAFENGKISILIASDLVSRGLDLPNLAHVINYDVPVSISSYVHRVGRTARAGKRGHAWTLFTPTEAWWFWNEIGRSNAVERAASSKIARVNIAASQFNEDQRAAYEKALEALRVEASSSNKSSLK